MLFNCHSYHFPRSYHRPDSRSSPASQKHLYSHIQTEKQTSAPHELKAEVKKPSTSTGKTYSVIHFCLLHHTQTAHDKTERDERVFLCSQTAYSPNNKSFCFSSTIRWCDSTDTSIEFRPKKRQDMTVKVYICLALPVLIKHLDIALFSRSWGYTNGADWTENITVEKYKLIHALVIWTSIFYILYIYICVCVCVCAFAEVHGHQTETLSQLSSAL